MATTNQTVPTNADVDAFVAAVAHPTRRQDAQTLLELFAEITDEPAQMWGSSIIGYGEYHYRYDSGRAGSFLVTGFSPRKHNLSLYIMPGYADFGDILDRLGKHKLGKSCLYVNKLADIDLDVLRELIVAGIEDMQARYSEVRI